MHLTDDGIEARNFIKILKARNNGSKQPLKHMRKPHKARRIKQGSNSTQLILGKRSSKKSMLHPQATMMVLDGGEKFGEVFTPLEKRARYLRLGQTFCLLNHSIFPFFAEA